MGRVCFLSGIRVRIWWAQAGDDPKRSNESLMNVTHYIIIIMLWDNPFGASAEKTEE
jgi:hypothetical protein